MNFKVEVNTPAAPQAPPLAPNSAPNRPQAPAAPPVKSGANSPLPPEPPKLGRPAPVAAEPEPGKPLTPAEIEANKAKQAVFGELESWRQSIANTYGFNAVGVADPFMPVESVARPPDKAKAASQEAKPMIQQLALNQFSLSAIIVAENPSNNKALVDSGGKGYIITIGTLIGNNNGKVREITPTKVIIEEPESTYRASGKPRITEFRLSTVRDSENMELFLAE
jgi:type IV pilus assembly protein PilP